MEASPLVEAAGVAGVVEEAGRGRATEKVSINIKEM